MCASGWTVGSRTPGYTPPSDTSPSCAHSPSLLVDVASTGGTWSASCMTSPTYYITSDMSNASGCSLLVLLQLLGSAFKKSNSYSGACFAPQGGQRNKTIHQEKDVNWKSICVCVYMCVQKEWTLDEYQENDRLMRTSGYQATGKLRRRHVHSARPWYLTASVWMRPCPRFNFQIGIWLKLYIELFSTPWNPVITHNCANWSFLCANIRTEPCNYCNLVSS